MTFILESVAAGILGTLAMTLFLTLVTRSRLTNADMVLAVGSLATRSLAGARKVGLVLHLLAGALFGLLYGAFLAHLATVESTEKMVLFAAVIGFFHGVVVSMAIVVAVAEHHPLEQFRRPGVEVALAHVVAHVIYGGVTGYFLAQLG